MKILVTGSTGMVGTNLCESLSAHSLLQPSRKELNLLNQQEVYSYIK